MTRKNSPTKDEYSVIAELRWIEYWIIFTLVWYAKLTVSEFLLWPSMIMITSLILQHSYFMGASKTIAFVVNVSTTLTIRNRKVQKEKKESIITDNMRRGGGEGEGDSSGSSSGGGGISSSGGVKGEEGDDSETNLDPILASADGISTPIVVKSEFIFKQKSLRNRRSPV